MHQIRYEKRDLILSVCLCLLVLAAGYGSLRFRLTDWGDDHSAYILEGIALSEGTFREQTEINYIIHPTQLSTEATDGKLVYSWGYPLLLSIVCKAVGFDRVNYLSLFRYKLPALLGFGMMAAVLYLFFRRRFSYPVSVLLSLMFCFTPDIFEYADIVSPDLLCLSFCILVFLLCEIYTGFPDPELYRILPLAAGYGIVLWFTYELRLNGFTVCLTALFGHLFVILKKRLFADRRKVFVSLMPFFIAAMIAVFTDHVLLAPATQNISDYSRTYSYVFTRHLSRQFPILSDYVCSLFGFEYQYLVYIALVLAFLGLWKGIRQDPHLVIFMFGTYFLVAALPYSQGLRYLFNGLPVFLMLIGYGVQVLWESFNFLLKKASFPIPEMICFTVRIIPVLFLTVCLFLNLFPLIRNDIDNLTQKELFYSSEPYSENAVEVYRFIRDELPENVLIAFRKPRALFLNTGRLSIKPGVNGHEVRDADYYLFDKEMINDADPDETVMKVIFENPGFTLYQILPGT